MIESLVLFSLCCRVYSCREICRESRWLFGQSNKVETVVLDSNRLWIPKPWSRFAVSYIRSPLGKKRNRTLRFP